MLGSLLMIIGVCLMGYGFVWWAVIVGYIIKDAFTEQTYPKYVPPRRVVTLAERLQDRGAYPGFVR